MIKLLTVFFFFWGCETTKPGKTTTSVPNVGESVAEQGRKSVTSMNSHRSIHSCTLLGIDPNSSPNQTLPSFDNTFKLSWELAYFATWTDGLLCTFGGCLFHLGDQWGSLQGLLPRNFPQRHCNKRIEHNQSQWHQHHLRYYPHWRYKLLHHIHTGSMTYCSHTPWQYDLLHHIHTGSITYRTTPTLPNASHPHWQYDLLHHIPTGTAHTRTSSMIHCTTPTLVVWPTAPHSHWQYDSLHHIHTGNITSTLAVWSWPTAPHLHWQYDLLPTLATLKTNCSSHLPPVWSTSKTLIITWACLTYRCTSMTYWSQHTIWRKANYPTWMVVRYLPPITLPYAVTCHRSCQLSHSLKKNLTRLKIQTKLCVFAKSSGPKDACWYYACIISY